MILCVGEILVDMIESDNSSGTFKAFAGGAAFNVACAIKKFGGSCGFCGAVGKDVMGKFLYDYAAARKFDYLNIRTLNNANTTMAFVTHDEKGERYFDFYRNRSADYLIDVSGVDASVLKRASIINIGSLMLGKKTGENRFFEILEKARRSGVKTAFDVNYRKGIFSSESYGVGLLKKVIDIVDFVKLSKEEATMLTDTDNIERAIGKLSDKKNNYFITLGREGSCCIIDGKQFYQSSIEVKQVDTTGAGDAFWGAILSKLDTTEDFKNDKAVSDMLKYANICGALTTTGNGAIDALPDMATVESYYSKFFKE